jgi:virginiamycin B lyase
LSVAFNEFPIPTADSGPNEITAGPDGNLWFTEGAGRIGRITPAGVITELTIPTADGDPFGITPGPDGNLWFTETMGNRIGRITPAGVITEFAIPTANSGPSRITTGPDGNLWFTESTANQIGRITTAGVVTGEFLIPSAVAEPIGITPGPDGALWFTESGNSDAIGRITTSGTFSPTAPFSVSNGPIGITTGPDGNLWFAGPLSNHVGRISTSGTLAMFQTTRFPLEITTGPDGNLWFTEGAQVGEITPSGSITEFPFPGDESTPTGITAGPDGNVWFVEHGANKVGEVVLSTPISGPDLAVSGTASSSVATGQKVIYTLTATNNGTAAATGVILTDTLPAGVTFVSATGGATPVSGVLTFPLGNLVAGATASVTIVVTSPAAGTLTNQARVSSNQADPTPADDSITQLTTVSRATGPVVTSVHRFGFHARPTLLVLTFDRPLNPGRAQDPGNYRIVELGEPRREIRVGAAVYDAAARTVTLSPVRRLNLHDLFRLTVNGTGPGGLTDTSGNLLDGRNNGDSGSNFVTIVTAADLVLTTTSPAILREYREIVSRQSSILSAAGSKRTL